MACSAEFLFFLFFKIPPFLFAVLSKKHNIWHNIPGQPPFYYSCLSLPGTHIDYGVGEKWPQTASKWCSRTLSNGAGCWEKHNLIAPWKMKLPLPSFTVNTRHFASSTSLCFPPCKSSGTLKNVECDLSEQKNMHPKYKGHIAISKKFLSFPCGYPRLLS